MSSASASMAMVTVLESAEHCDCGNRGWYVVANRSTGEPEQEQCEFCYTESNSMFNALERVKAHLRKDGGEAAQPAAWMCKAGLGSVGFAEHWHEVEFWKKQYHGVQQEIVPLYRSSSAAPAIERVDKMLRDLEMMHVGVTGGTGYDPAKYSSSYSEARDLIRDMAKALYVPQEEKK